MKAMISVLQFVKVEDWDSLEIRSENLDVEWPPSNGFTMCSAQFFVS
jgi:hypothetical protein